MSLTWVAGWEESVVSVFPHPSSPWLLVEDASSASPSRLAWSCPSPILLFVASSLSHAPALSPSPSLSVGVPSRGDLSPSLCPGSAPEDHVHVHAPDEVDWFSFRGKKTPNMPCIVEFAVIALRKLSLFYIVNKLNKKKQYAHPSHNAFCLPYPVCGTPRAYTKRRTHI